MDDQSHPKAKCLSQVEEVYSIPCIIHVFRNGDLLCPPFRFIIPRNMQQDLEQVLSLVTDKVSLRTGAVRRLCSLEGVPVCSASELETGHSYVAVGTERFKKLPYVEMLVSKAAERHYPGKRRMHRRNENRKEVNGTEDQYSDSALLNSPEIDGRRIRSTGDEATAEASEDPAVFFSRPVKVRKNRGHLLPNAAAQHSVFKRAGRRRREEVRGAQEVAEDENTATELPIDQRVAETVEDEELIATELPDRNRGVPSRTDDNQETFENAENEMSREPTKHQSQDHAQKEIFSKSRPSSQERVKYSKTEEQKHQPQDIVTNGVAVSS
ncbi:hypothetical protein WMY93_017673 [Mugilogobius chulae]|uniref:Doublecortin domain-containing protein n=1 Tax=Mugilogobius chulae TaxID=88201 RepID=A0AAW0P0E5_9GOBI